MIWTPPPFHRHCWNWINKEMQTNSQTKNWLFYFALLLKSRVRLRGSDPLGKKILDPWLLLTVSPADRMIPVYLNFVLGAIHQTMIYCCFLVNYKTVHQISDMFSKTVLGNYKYYIEPFLRLLQVHFPTGWHYPSCINDHGTVKKIQWWTWTIHNLTQDRKYFAPMCMRTCLLSLNCLEVGMTVSMKPKKLCILGPDSLETNSVLSLTQCKY